MSHLVLKSETLCLQVLGFAAFFALVLKKVDQEEYGEPPLDENLRSPGRFFCFLVSLLFYAVGWFCIKEKTVRHQYKNPPSDNPDAVRSARRDSACSFYKPPPPTDIERMRNNMIKEQKVFALIREILGRKATVIQSN